MVCRKLGQGCRQKDNKNLLKNQALPIAETIYSGCSILFLLDNVTSHSVYV